MSAIRTALRTAGLPETVPVPSETYACLRRTCVACGESKPVTAYGTTGSNKRRCTICETCEWQRIRSYLRGAAD